MQTHKPESAQTLIETSPSESFETPEKLLADSNIAPDKNAQLLEQWAIDLAARPRTADENMPGTEPGQTGDMLRRVKSAQRLLAAA